MLRLSAFLTRLAKREGLPRRSQKLNKIRHFLQARGGRVYQSCVPKSTAFCSVSYHCRRPIDALVARAADDMAEAIDDRTVSEWIAWARKRLTEYDPLEAGPGAVFREIASIDQWTYRDD
jgi:hypothetical protein